MVSLFQRAEISHPMSKPEQKPAGGLLLSQPMVQAALAPPAPGCAVIPTLSQDFLLFPDAWLAMSPRTVIIFCSLDSLNA